VQFDPSCLCGHTAGKTIHALHSRKSRFYLRSVIYPLVAANRRGARLFSPSAIQLLAWWLFVAVSLPVVAAEHPAPPELERWTGNYAMSRDQVMRIVHESDHLVAIPPGNQPSAILQPDQKPGKFWMRGANFEFQFVTSSSGQILRLEITGPDGMVRKLPRLTDSAGARASVRATAVHADTAVLARVFNGYERTRDAAGKFRPETYVFGEGGFQSTNPMRDPALEGMKFDELALLLAPGLTNQGYVTNRDKDEVDLLIMVYWGATASDEHPAVIAEEERDPVRHTFRDQLNRENARLLGFESVLPLTDPERRSAMNRDSVERLEESRYWVALVALDFRLLHREKTTKPLWSVRYNMASRGVSFTKALPQMTQVAAHFFGRDSGGLLERGTTDAEGTVELGETIVVEEDVPRASEESPTAGPE
jgi:hypothetical protein